LIGGAAGCADPSRVDAVERELARVHAESAQRQRETAWLYWATNILVERTRAPAGGDGREALVRRIAALEAQNAALAARLDRAEHRLDPSAPSAPAASPQPTPTRVLDQTSPYEAALAK
jgi:hypothetical protein